MLFAQHEERLTIWTFYESGKSPKKIHVTEQGSLGGATRTVYKVFYEWLNQTIGKQHTLRTEEMQMNKNESK